MFLKIIVNCCCQSQNYKIWKQFTTTIILTFIIVKLLSITKLQNLKAIHNNHNPHFYYCKVVVNHKTTKFESNSQRGTPCSCKRLCCCQSQNYKIWKQFTTWYPLLLQKVVLLSITKLQNLKAIHNSLLLLDNSAIVVVNHKTTKFESNSQHGFQFFVRAWSCCQSQNYKIWKQFTTMFLYSSLASKLLSITKLQNLKAIHNLLVQDHWYFAVVVNHKTTKFESNSQRALH